MSFQTEYWIIASGEICSPGGGVDDDCDGLIDEGFDVDGDGYETCEGDCDDGNPSINPGVTSEFVNNAACIDWQDNDCDGSVDCFDTDCAGSVACSIYDPDSPIVIDVEGNGFDLTSFENGVLFDLDTDGIPEQLSWTSENSDDVWLSLDRNGNGVIENGSELFGNFTLQPDPPAGELKNGFLALAVFDQPENGGNGDGQIDRRDNVFSRLRLWRDLNHNGISTPNELRRLSVSPIRVLELTYYESHRIDEHRNRFRYRARVRDERGAQVGRWAWDVFLVSH